MYIAQHPTACMIRCMNRKWYEVARQVMETQQISQEEMAERMGVTPGAVGHWLNGKREPKIEVINRFLTELGLPILTTSIPASEPGMHNVEPTVQPSRFYRYPVISWVEAGGWSEAVEPYPAGYSDTFEISDYKAKGRAFWLVVRGDSMTAPAGQSIPEGMLILVDTGIEPTAGKLVIAKLPESNEATFKKLVEDAGRYFLKPLNPAYPTLAVTEECKLIGVIRQMTMRL
ncbi:helix-turn-helix domain-containing protein [Pseudomonas savastanoi]|nr:helix-turn-helix domain-containing protein [Pseudomonas amygdali pv. tabaci str. ATCC 11528]QOI07064.1 helix-turn-helix domain-containing protein [Pseudomonas savastanoi]